MTTMHDGRYRIDGERGRGETTMVLEATDTLLQGPRALKLLRPESSDDLGLRQRFLTEARALARVTHPNVVRVYDLFHDEARGPVLVMELARGRLRQVEPAWPLAPRRAAEVLDQALAGLGVLHGQGITHRDLRPENLLTGRAGAVLLSDLSSAHLDGEARVMRTMAGDVLGHALYAAPEARVDSRRATPLSDIYAAGATLYVLLTGDAPPDLSLLDFDDRILNRLPEAFRPIVKRATARRPDDRYPSAGSMRQAVQGVAP
jgi:serine/threonine protein kinase